MMTPLAAFWIGGVAGVVFGAVMVIVALVFSGYGGDR